MGSDRAVPSFPELFAPVFVILLLAIGLPSNVISFIVWTKGKESKSLGCSMYFRLLTLSDAFSLLVCFTWVNFQYYVPHNLLFFFIFFSPSLSTWLILCMSIERYMSLIYPFSFRPAGARIRALICFVSLILILTGINSHVFIYDRIYFSIWYEIASLWTLCIIPFVLINLTNILILIKLCKMRQQRLGQSRRPNPVTSFTKIAITSCVLQTISIVPLTIMLLAIFDYLDKDILSMSGIDTIISSTLYLNNCFNVFIYYINSSIFRSDFKNIFCCCCRRNTIHQSNATTNTAV
ncbi:Coagulation factor II (thrombin) receptor-like 1 [Mactra antiquata]